MPRTHLGHQGPLAHRLGLPNFQLPLGRVDKRLCHGICTRLCIQIQGQPGACKEDKALDEVQHRASALLSLLCLLMYYVWFKRVRYDDKIALNWEKTDIFKSRHIQRENYQCLKQEGNSV